MAVSSTHRPLLQLWLRLLVISYASCLGQVQQVTVRSRIMPFPQCHPSSCPLSAKPHTLPSPPKSANPLAAAFIMPGSRMLPRIVLVAAIAVEGLPLAISRNKLRR
ncbi:hypothetical protein B0T25DRAFT_98843 [Lasiosphaeria hispida]|uniref:Secreted protein n=1 Tax=Lasiosphaeria hispida TaxID=260671 RepID=A0AAJ0HQL8_9PEZI|nr:hypothetical protein B0T25DRAFT_98843 [Lasiosphaeria hispida]